MDTIIGKVLEFVDKQDPNTYIIYLGDNGTWMFGEKREFIDNMYITRQDRGKGTAYESGARVEMAIRGPRIKAGSKSEVPVHAVDLFSTILEMAGLDVPKMVPKQDRRRNCSSRFRLAHAPSCSRVPRACAIPLKIICSRKQ
jgi:arylsulfatase A-like enzyme